MAAPTLERADIQGDILRAYGNAYDRTSYLFVRVAEAAAGRAWLGGLVDRVTTAEPWTGAKPDTALNVAVTYAGLDALGVPKDVCDTFSEEFCDGMAKRAELLGDTGASAPSDWDDNLGTGAAHVLLTINAKTAAHLEAELDSLRDGMPDAVSVVHEQHAQLLPNAREHFGFGDGFAQPAIEGDSDERAPGGGVPEGGGRWRALAPGEFILGYPDEDTRVDPEQRILPNAPADPLGRNGTYMIYRKLHQDVALFRRVLRDAAQLYHGGDEEKLRAKVVGRWSNGKPLVKSPDAPDPAFDAAAPGANDFRYLPADVSGYACPLGAHIRRSNPRDALGWEKLDTSGLLSFRHRMIRRGMPYGPPLPEGVTEDDRQDRGLVFVCFNASISRQFESVQLQWLNDGNGFRLGHDKDFLLGDSGTTGKMTVQGEPPFFLSPQRSFVTTKGGEYLFVPGIRALRALAGGVGG